MTSTLTGWIGDYGLYAVFTLMLVDAVFPAASELVMLYAGVLAAGAIADHVPTFFGYEIHSTGWGYVAMAMAGTLGYLAGSLIGWVIGYYGGRPLVERHGRWFHLSPQKLDRAEAWFERWDDPFVFFGRMIPLIRSFVSIPAGVMEVRLGRYTVLTFLGTLPWCFGLAGAGLALGKSWESFHHTWRYADYAVGILVVAAVAYILLRWLRGRARRESAEESA